MRGEFHEIWLYLYHCRDLEVIIGKTHIAFQQSPHMWNYHLFAEFEFVHLKALRPSTISHIITLKPNVQTLGIIDDALFSI